MKFVVLGDTSVGKTSLLLRYVKNQFSEDQETTVGGAFLQKNAVVDGYLVQFEIWDTAGQERYHSLSPMYYRGSAAAIVVYDITNRPSWVRAKSWVKELQKTTPETVIAFAGNKVDLADQRKVEFEEAKEYCDAQDIIFMETSAKLNSNISEIWKKVAQKVPKEKLIQKPRPAHLLIDPELLSEKSESKSDGCCK